jgi:phthalate 4,5-dioxygenase oxygenase subunit
MAVWSLRRVPIVALELRQYANFRAIDPAANAGRRREGTAMLSRESNALITLTGAGTPGGAMMRRYWQPVALSAELPADAPVPVRIMGEDLVLFRDGDGKPALVGRRCPHRRVDLSYGRVEDGGLRCLYHGWLMSGDGRCLEQPGEPAGGDYKDRIKHPAYPCDEAGGVILTYMGPAPAPLLPEYPFMAASPDRVWTTKLHHECNYLQGNEGNLDPQHLSYLHRFISAKDLHDADLNTAVSRDPAPRLDYEETPYGLRIFASRVAGEGRSYIRMTNFIMPNCSSFEGSPLVDPRRGKPRDNQGYQMNWHVPIDDVEHWKYMILYSHETPIDRDFIEKIVFSDIGADYRLARNAGNRYQQDRAEMKRTSFAGFGGSFWAHDKFAVEAQGVIVDRSEEHLGATDRPTRAMRRQLLRAVEDVRDGRDPLLVARPGQPNALATMAVVSKEMPSTTDALGTWWQEFAPQRRELEAHPGE